ncbi:Zn-dependent exopeptidase [Polychaeton citri CBS 116435]|uniref:Zn-dependent exopeptidase n=1 Tax=Polychaeton citri CBS 116435 TaxID=1314669 RepID=A0A9P4QEY3_9PEZI|nr:Zn-dependent exopeptidase [Polychaeton citri CBS 116435]
MLSHDSEDPYKRYAHLPIPTYEEATTSRPSSSQNSRGPVEVSDDAERQGLLGERGATTSRGQEGYRPPTVESPRGSEDSDLQLPEVEGGDRDSDRRQIEEFDYLEPGEDEGNRNTGLYHRARLRSKFSQRWNNISATLSNLRLPRLRGFYTPLSHDADDSPDSPTAATPASTDPWLARIWSRIPSSYRLSGPNAARLFGLFTIVLVVYILFSFDMFPNQMRNMGARFDPESVRSYVQEHISDSGDAMQDWLRHITSFDHVAGTKGDYVMAEWMKERWAAEGGLDEIALMEYLVYLNYPQVDVPSEVSVHPGNNVDFESYWHAEVQEGKVYEDREQPLVWHGHSEAGSATGHLIYANGGSREDFQWLADNSIQTKESIALVRAYATQPDISLKIKAAEEAGCVGVLIFSDPAENGLDQDAVWPEGPLRPFDSVQRGGVGLTSWVVGDPLTPGWASTPGAARLAPANNQALPNIPSIPLAWNDARVLLQNLTMNGGFGARVPESWRGGDAIFDKKTIWYSGSALLGEHDDKTPVVSMANRLDSNQKQPIWNLHGSIEGMETPHQKVIVGNHRDSWCFGASDPGSGSAVLMELISIFSELRRLGWRPLRTIEFVSWDAADFNLIGSTEYVEDNVDYLRDNGVAYLNVGAGVSGPNFHADGSPLLERPLLHVLDRISDPHSNNTKTVRQIWNDEKSELGPTGAKGDSVAFQDIAGMSSLDFGFKGDGHGFPSESCYESLDWMLRFGDSEGLPYHRALAQIWALLILEIADRPLLPFDTRDYARKLAEYVDALGRAATQEYQSDTGIDADEARLQQATSFTLTALRDAASKLGQQAADFHAFEDEWTTNVLGRGGFETAHYALRRVDFNNRLAAFDTWLLDTEENMNAGGRIKGREGEHDHHGVPGREQFRHIVFGPSTRNGHEVALFPAITDAIEAKDWKGAQAMVDKARLTRWVLLDIVLSQSVMPKTSLIDRNVMVVSNRQSDLEARLFGCIQPISCAMAGPTWNEIDRV